MEWTSHNAGERYTTTQGTCQSTVWRDTTGQWTAVVSSEGLAVGQNSFASLEDAWAWCEAQLADLAAAGRCAQ